MDPALIFFGLFFLIKIVLVPFLGAEGRPEFLRPDRKKQPMAGSMRQEDWGRPRDWPF